jgi:hypothetical protein
MENVCLGQMGRDYTVVRNLYRVYLYAVCIILLITATITTGVSLVIWLSNTALRGPYGSPPDRSQVVQSVVAFVVVWLVTLLLGGLHYWLIRRDMATDPAADGGAVRSFFLNVTQLLAILIAVGEAAVGIAIAGQPYNTPIGSFSAAVAAGGLVALLQWERSRTRATTSWAKALERLHLYGAQLILVFIATPFWLQAVQYTVESAAVHLGTYNPCAYYYARSDCIPESYYPLRQLVAQWGAALFIAACWVGYTAISRGDRHSRLRQALHLLAFGFALSFVLRGSQGIFEAILRQALGNPFSANDSANGAGQALGALVFGIVALLAYRWLYTREATDLPSGEPAAGLAWQAVAAIVFAYPFWFGAATLLSDAVERVVPGGVLTPAGTIAQAGALLLTGLPFVFFAVRLGMRTRQTDVTWPHRVFVLVLLASGTIASAAGLVITLQAFLSALLGAPPDGWQHTVRNGLVTLLVGGTMVAIFATLAARNRYLAGRQEPKPIEAQPVSSADTGALEAILDALLAGNLSRDEAAARIRARDAIR